MNRKTFALAFLWFLVTLCWFGYNVYELVRCLCMGHVWNLLVSFAILIFSALVVHNEYHKKRRRHIEDVRHDKIP